MFFVSPLPSPAPLELLALSILCINFKVHLCLFYRPPSSNALIFDDLLNYLESINAGQLSNFILLGDFNVNNVNTSNPMYYNLCTLPSLYCLTQAVTGPTNEHHDGSTSTIDLVFMSEPSTLQSCTTIPPLSNSNHIRIMVTLNRKPIKAEKTKGRLVWRYSFADWLRACRLIDDFDWDSILSQNVELSWKLSHQQFMLIMAESIPKKGHTHKKESSLAK